MKKIIIILLAFLVGGTTKAQVTTTISKQTQVEGKSVQGMWKPGSVTLLDGQEKEGEAKGFSYSGDNVKKIKFRTSKGAEVETYSASECKAFVWDGTIVFSLPKNFKNPEKGNRFYIALYAGKNVSVLFDPKAQTSTGGFNTGEKLSVLFLKNGNVTKVSKLKFKKELINLFSDNSGWVNKAKNKTNKKWFKYSNMYDVVADYDTTK